MNGPMIGGEISAGYLTRRVEPLPAWATHRELQRRLLARVSVADPDRFAGVSEADLIPLWARVGMPVVTIAMGALVERYSEEQARG